MPRFESPGVGSWKNGETDAAGSLENSNFNVTLPAMEYNLFTGSNTSDLQGPSGSNPNQLPVDWDAFLAELNLQPQHPNTHGVCPEDLEPGWWLSANSDASS
jgi:hypothetical protein